jgi:hypothetical protein
MKRPLIKQEIIVMVLVAKPSSPAFLPVGEGRKKHQQDEQTHE